MDTTKNDIGHHETLRDEDIIGEKRIGQDRVEHLRQLSPDELVAEKKLRRKIDRLIMPVVVTVYLMNYIDRNNYAAARLQGLEDDLGLKGDQYQTALSILFVGYVRQHRRSFHKCTKANTNLGSYASPLKRRDELRRQTISIPRIFHMRMGPRVSAHQPSQGLRRHGRLSFHLGNRRGSILCRCALLPFKVVHQERAQPSNVHLLLRIHAFRRIRSFDRCWNSFKRHFDRVPRYHGLAMGTYKQTPFTSVYNRSEANATLSCTSSKAPLRFSSDLL